MASSPPTHRLGHRQYRRGARPRRGPTPRRPKAPACVAPNAWLRAGGGCQGGGDGPDRVRAPGAQRRNLVGRLALIARVWRRLF